MARFNFKTNVTNTENLAGGKAFTETPELELVSILLTSFFQDQYYRSAAATGSRLVELLKLVKPEFAAKAAIFARNEFGLRTITHVLAAEVAGLLAGKPFAKSFYDKVIHRPDDMLEIASYYFAHKSKKLTNAMKGGFAQAFNRFDAYQLAKYRGENHAVKLIDMVNLVHPTPNEKNAEALKQLVADTLRSTDTWEAKLTQAGQKAKSEEEKVEMKFDAFRELIETRKIGYFALLRNLRNILELNNDKFDTADNLLPKTIALLTDARLIKNSLVLPFRFLTAVEEMNKVYFYGTREVIVALNDAIDISCSNVPVFDGKTIVVADYSGSMGDGTNSNKGKASLLGAILAILAKSNNADFMIFGDDAAYINYDPDDSVLTIAENMMCNNRDEESIHVGHGTNFNAIFHKLNKSYNRVIILSDMQGWIGGGAPISSFASYKQNHSCSRLLRLNG